MVEPEVRDRVGECRMRGADRSSLSPPHLCDHRCRMLGRRFGGLELCLRFGDGVVAGCLSGHRRWRVAVVWVDGFGRVRGRVGRILSEVLLRRVVVEVHRTDSHSQVGNRYAASISWCLV